MTAATLRVKVASKTVEALDISAFELVSVDGESLPPFSAGAHVDVHLPEGLTRQYSLCNDPRDARAYVIAVLRDAASRGGSTAIHDQVDVGDELDISEPRNHFPLAHDASKHLLVAGGIGVTPILCMAERLSVVGEPFEMHYCTRSVERTAFRDRIAASRFAAQVTFHHDDEGPDKRLDLDALLGSPAAGHHLYVCGPKAFMDWVLDGARARQWPAERLHYEFFGADVAPLATDDSFEVVLASTGRTIEVARDKTVAQALLEAGVEVATSCEQGVCGTCLTRVLEGIPDHRDLYLTEEEQASNDQFTPCCSRSKSARLVLDL